MVAKSYSFRKVLVLIAAIGLLSCGSEDDDLPDADIEITVSNFTSVIELAKLGHTYQAIHAGNNDVGTDFALGLYNDDRPILPLVETADLTLINPPPPGFDIFYECINGGSIGTDINISGTLRSFVFEYLDCTDITNVTYSGFRSFSAANNRPGVAANFTSFTRSFQDFASVIKVGELESRSTLNGDYEYQTWIDPVNENFQKSKVWLGEQLGYTSSIDDQNSEQQIERFRLEGRQTKDAESRILFTEYEYRLAVYSSAFEGTIQVETDDAILYETDQNFPSQGSVRVSGLNSSLLIEYLDSTNATVSIDENNDGVYELQTTMLWGDALPELIFE